MRHGVEVAFNLARLLVDFCGLFVVLFAAYIVIGARLDRWHRERE